MFRPDVFFGWVSMCRGVCVGWDFRSCVLSHKQFVWLFCKEQCELAFDVVILQLFIVRQLSVLLW